MRLHSLCAAPVVVVLLTLSACGGDTFDDSDDGPAFGDVPPVGPLVRGLAHPGRWAIPAPTLAVGDTQYVPYTGAGPWVGSDGCSGGMTAGAKVFREWLYANFPQAYHIGGYACRAIVGNDSKMSVHATGRALDVMIQTIDSEADNDMGDPIGNWLIEHAQAIGIQYIIWDRTSWMAARSVGDKERYYSGQHPHHDHLHVELSLEAAAKQTPFFSGPMEPPVLTPCALVGATGGIVEEDGPCATVHGPSAYWRAVSDRGHGGSLLWTNAFKNDDPSNWGMWSLFFETAGRYDVQAWLEPDYARWSETPYVIYATGTQHKKTIDQSAGSGWTSLGSYDFDDAGFQYVTVADNSATDVPADQHIVFDALRLVPSGACGDDRCTDNESCESCQTDCGPCPLCGDARCNGDETCETCADDCGLCRACGDGTCDANETCEICSEDCGPCEACGDGTCNGDESCETCPDDCGTCDTCGNWTCDAHETCESCWLDCGRCRSCGDGVCLAPETCELCPNDCGECEQPDTVTEPCIGCGGSSDVPPTSGGCRSLPGSVLQLLIALLLLGWGVTERSEGRVR